MRLEKTVVQTTLGWKTDDRNSYMKLESQARQQNVKARLREDMKLGSFQIRMLLNCLNKIPQVQRIFKPLARYSYAVIVFSTSDIAFYDDMNKVDNYCL